MQNSGKQQEMATAVAANSRFDMSSIKDEEKLELDRADEGKFEGSSRKPECEGIDATKSGRSGSIVGLSEVGKVGLIDETEADVDQSTTLQGGGDEEKPKKAPARPMIRRANTLHVDSPSAAITSAPAPECFRGICAVMGMCICNMKDRAQPTIASSKLCQNSFRKLAVEAQEAPPPEVEKPVRPDVIKEKDGDKLVDGTKEEEGGEKEEEGSGSEEKGAEEKAGETTQNSSVGGGAEESVNLVGSTVKGFF
ncbi:hypothetical protein GUITHDRAFT_155877 [Guillardia theta CCMP2712]|uniref:Uncharacterized protein n=1 Tax=Guillardia theta (strain CCMP2712) TaxID=905079 RepID=L1ICQ7_GUITC|nr:hypothetical protein GUITHDRAFT_155877 [Guillardia theta CCMP2712]EKX34018.1 hypothetical protein GUITHDRAFT_155877 [Guillardia theta CCMP2712]|eukprot:XP_005820998.1 hypothetical protein GUITHDRAFT_155877 [Guillardia theta CCMP2712]